MGFTPPSEERRVPVRFVAADPRCLSRVVHAPDSVPLFGRPCWSRFSRDPPSDPGRQRGEAGMLGKRVGKTNGGDNRGFSTAANASSRTSISIKIETDPKIRPGNPIISVDSHAGQSTTIKNGQVVETATATKGLPTATGTRDENGTPIINIQQDTKNPLSPGPQALTPGITANLNVLVYQDASTTQVTGTAANFPASELNVTRADGTTTPVIQFLPPADATPFSLLKPDREVDVEKETPACNGGDKGVHNEACNRSSLSNHCVRWILLVSFSNVDWPIRDSFFVVVWCDLYRCGGLAHRRNSLVGFDQ